MPAAANLVTMPTLEEQLQHLREKRDLLDQRIAQLEQVRQRRQQVREKVGRVLGFIPRDPDAIVFRVLDPAA